MDTTAIIALSQKIPLNLTVTDKTTGKPIPGAQISNVQWSQDNEIGQISATSDPSAYLFTPTKAGTVDITASATVTIP